jgi:hypothetical protein
MATMEKLILSEMNLLSFDDSASNSLYNPEETQKSKAYMLLQLGENVLNLRHARITEKSLRKQGRTTDPYYEQSVWQIKNLKQNINILQEQLDNLRKIVFFLDRIRQLSWEIVTDNLNNASYPEYQTMSEDEYIVHIIDQIKEAQIEIDHLAVIKKYDLPYYYECYLQIQEQYHLP